MSAGTKEPGIDILNTGHGHTEVRFTGENAVEMERAKRIIQDMLRRGYVLFVEGADKALIRVQSFDPEKNVYIIADGPLYAGEVSPAAVEDPPPATAPAPGPPPKRGRGRPRREVPVDKVRTTAIARSAGG